MKKLFAAVALASAVGAATPALAADLGVSVQISQPGVFGRIDIGQFPQPQVWVPQPVIITRPVVYAEPPPVYMWVPPGHRKHWNRHCAEYRACGVPVYFVRDDWYGQHVRPYGPRPERRDERWDDRRGDRHDDRRDDRRDERREDHGHGRGHDRHD